MEIEKTLEHLADVNGDQTLGEFAEALADVLEGAILTVPVESGLSVCGGNHHRCRPYSLENDV